MGPGQLRRHNLPLTGTAIKFNHGRRTGTGGRGHQQQTCEDEVKQIPFLLFICLPYRAGLNNMNPVSMVFSKIIQYFPYNTSKYIFDLDLSVSPPGKSAIENNGDQT